MSTPHYTGEGIRGTRRDEAFPSKIKTSDLRAKNKGRGKRRRVLAKTNTGWVSS